jgi:hypothetical protein
MKMEIAKSIPKGVRCYGQDDLFYSFIFVCAYDSVYMLYFVNG